MSKIWMTNLSCILFVSFLTIGCDNQKYKQKIYLYDRFVGGINGFMTYHDKLAMTEYENNSFTISQLVAFAKNYVDTVKSDKPVSNVAFIAQKHGQKLPNRGMSSYPRLAHYCIFSVAFDNAFRDKANNEKKEITSIALWHEEGVATYWNKSEIDSLMRLTTPIASDF